jgi:hypothetical protein
VNALATRSIRTTGRVPPVDELDQRIELYAAKWAALILAIAIIAWVVVAMYAIIATGAAGDSSSTPAVPMLTAMEAVQWLFAAFVLANAVYYGGIVVRYRRLAIA